MRVAGWGIGGATRNPKFQISAHPFKKALACPTGPLGEIETVQYTYFISVSFSGTLETTTAQLNSTSGMPLLGQPSFCLKVTSSLVLFLFKTQDDLTVKRCLQPIVVPLVVLKEQSFSLYLAFLSCHSMLFNRQMSLCYTGHTSLQSVLLPHSSTMAEATRILPCQILRPCPSELRVRSKRTHFF